MSAGLQPISRAEKPLLSQLLLLQLGSSIFPELLEEFPERLLILEHILGPVALSTKTRPTASLLPLVLLLNRPNSRFVFSFAEFFQEFFRLARSIFMRRVFASHVWFKQDLCLLWQKHLDIFSRQALLTCRSQHEIMRFFLRYRPGIAGVVVLQRLDPILLDFRVSIPTEKESRKHFWENPLLYALPPSIQRQFDVFIKAYHRAFSRPCVQELDALVHCYHHLLIAFLSDHETHVSLVQDLLVSGQTDRDTNTTLHGYLHHLHVFQESIDHLMRMAPLMGELGCNLRALYLEGLRLSVSFTYRGDSLFSSSSLLKKDALSSVRQILIYHGLPLDFESLFTGHLQTTQRLARSIQGHLSVFEGMRDQLTVMFQQSKAHQVRFQETRLLYHRPSEETMNRVMTFFFQKQDLSFAFSAANTQLIFKLISQEVSMAQCHAFWAQGVVDRVYSLMRSLSAPTVIFGVLPLSHLVRKDVVYQLHALLRNVRNYINSHDLDASSQWLLSILCAAERRPVYHFSGLLIHYLSLGLPNDLFLAIIRRMAEIVKGFNRPLFRSALGEAISLVDTQLLSVVSSSWSASEKWRNSPYFLNTMSGYTRKLLLQDSEMPWTSLLIDMGPEEMTHSPLILTLTFHYVPQTLEEQILTPYLSALLRQSEGRYASRYRAKESLLLLSALFPESQQPTALASFTEYVSQAGDDIRNKSDLVSVFSSTPLFPFASYHWKQHWLLAVSASLQQYASSDSFLFVTKLLTPPLLSSLSRAFVEAWVCGIPHSQVLFTQLALLSSYDPELVRRLSDSMAKEFLALSLSTVQLALFYDFLRQKEVAGSVLVSEVARRIQQRLDQDIEEESPGLVIESRNTMSLSDVLSMVRTFPTTAAHANPLLTVAYQPFIHEFFVSSDVFFWDGVQLSLTPDAHRKLRIYCSTTLPHFYALFPQSYHAVFDVISDAFNQASLFGKVSSETGLSHALRLVGSSELLSPYQSLLFSHLCLLLDFLEFPENSAEWCSALYFLPDVDDVVRGSILPILYNFNQFEELLPRLSTLSSSDCLSHLSVAQSVLPELLKKILFPLVQMGKFMPSDLTAFTDDASTAQFCLEITQFIECIDRTCLENPVFSEADKALIAVVTRNYGDFLQTFSSREPEIYLRFVAIACRFLDGLGAVSLYDSALYEGLSTAMQTLSLGLSAEELSRSGILHAMLSQASDLDALDTLSTVFFDQFTLPQQTGFLSLIKYNFDLVLPVFEAKLSQFSDDRYRSSVYLKTFAHCLSALSASPDLLLSHADSGLLSSLYQLTQHFQRKPLLDFEHLSSLAMESLLAVQEGRSANVSLRRACQIIGNYRDEWAQKGWFPAEEILSLTSENLEESDIFLILIPLLSAVGTGIQEFSPEKARYLDDATNRLCRGLCAGLVLNPQRFVLYSGAFWARAAAVIVGYCDQDPAFISKSIPTAYSSVSVRYRLIYLAELLNRYDGALAELFTKYSGLMGLETLSQILDAILLLHEASFSDDQLARLIQETPDSVRIWSGLYREYPDFCIRLLATQSESAWSDFPVAIPAHHLLVLQAPETLQLDFTDWTYFDFKNEDLLSLLYQLGLSHLHAVCAGEEDQAASYCVWTGRFFYHLLAYHRDKAIDIFPGFLCQFPDLFFKAILEGHPNLKVWLVDAILFSESGLHSLDACIPIILLREPLFQTLVFEMLREKPAPLFCPAYVLYRYLRHFPEETISFSALPYFTDTMYFFLRYDQLDTLLEAHPELRSSCIELLTIHAKTAHFGPSITDVVYDEQLLIDETIEIRLMAALAQRAGQPENTHENEVLIHHAFMMLSSQPDAMNRFLQALLDRSTSWDDPVLLALFEGCPKQTSLFHELCSRVVDSQTRLYLHPFITQCFTLWLLSLKNHPLDLVTYLDWFCIFLQFLPESEGLMLSQQFLDFGIPSSKQSIALLLSERPFLTDGIRLNLLSSLFQNQDPDFIVEALKVADRSVLFFPLWDVFLTSHDLTALLGQESPLDRYLYPAFCQALASENWGLLLRYGHDLFRPFLVRFLERFYTNEDSAVALAWFFNQIIETRHTFFLTAWHDFIHAQLLHTDLTWFFSVIVDFVRQQPRSDAWAFLLMGLPPRFFLYFIPALFQENGFKDVRHRIFDDLLTIRVPHETFLRALVKTLSTRSITSLLLHENHSLFIRQQLVQALLSSDQAYRESVLNDLIASEHLSTERYRVLQESLLLFHMYDPILTTTVLHSQPDVFRQKLWVSVDALEEARSHLLNVLREPSETDKEGFVRASKAGLAQIDQGFSLLPLVASTLGLDRECPGIFSMFCHVMRRAYLSVLLPPRVLSPLEKERYFAKRFLLGIHVGSSRTPHITLAFLFRLLSPYIELPFDHNRLVEDLAQWTACLENRDYHALGSPHFYYVMNALLPTDLEQISRLYPLQLSPNFLLLQGIPEASVSLIWTGLQKAGVIKADGTVVYDRLAHPIPFHELHETVFESLNRAVSEDSQRLQSVIMQSKDLYAITHYRGHKFRTAFCRLFLNQDPDHQAWLTDCLYRLDTSDPGAQPLIQNLTDMLVAECGVSDVYWTPDALQDLAKQLESFGSYVFK